MKKTLFTLLLIFQGILSFAQLKREKEIDNIENYTFTEEKIFNSKEKINLYGELIEPDSYNEIVFIVPGTGQDSKNCHYILAHELLKNNFAVFRYDERGTGKSEGKYNTISYKTSDLASDVLLFYNQLKTKFPTKKIGFIGHSQGGLATMLLNRNGAKPDFLIQWATPVLNDDSWFKFQIKNVNAYYEDLRYESIDEKMEILSLYRSYFKGLKNEMSIKNEIKVLKQAEKEAKSRGYDKNRYERFPLGTLPIVRDIFKLDFSNEYKNITIPTLYIIGENDLLVDSINETKTIQSFNNSNITVKTLSQLDHYLTTMGLTFSSSEDKLNKMYEIDKNALEYIINWLKNTKTND